jgi:hypothetical protein
MLLTPEQRAAGIAHVEKAVADARAALEAADFHFWESDAKDQQRGAINIVATTSLRAMRELASRDDEGSDDKFISLAHDAEDSLTAIKGYTAEATFDSVIKSTATQTAADAGQLAGKAVDVVTSAAGAGLGALWSAVPLSIKLVGGLVVVGVGYVYLRPLLGLLPSRAK